MSSISVNYSSYLCQELQLLLCLCELPQCHLAMDDSRESFDAGLVEVEGLLVDLECLTHTTLQASLVGLLFGSGIYTTQNIAGM